MASVSPKLCLSDDELAAASLFMLEHRHELHTSFTVMDTLTLLYSYVTQGHMLCIVNDREEVVGVSAYFLGTREREFQDQHIAFVDVIIYAKAYRSGRNFIKGLAFLVNWIRNTHQEAQEIRLAALTENRVLIGMYSKIAQPIYERAGSLGPETVFSVGIDEISTTLKRIYQV